MYTNFLGLTLVIVFETHEEPNPNLGAVNHHKKTFLISLTEARKYQPHDPL